MAIDNFTIQASSVMTVVSLTTFIGILWWTFSGRRDDDFAEAERIPFADEFLDRPASLTSLTPTHEANQANEAENRHV
ncbi:cbb3-type cytochrome c oxidase subunit 3 [Herbaspirillum rhizosphaerae]|uniref:Cbb3-type cytochrome c oxidase subunit 3 n=1 Tax=Herbaspirillum rhizosphaerae TaxID=346179 RepID=A0ABW8ZBV1_9BURK